MKITPIQVLGVNWIGVDGLNAFICNYYDLPVDTQVCEIENDTEHFFTVERCPQENLTPLHGIDLEDQRLAEVALYDNSLEVWQLGHLLSRICNQGGLEPGNYLVLVSW